VEQTKPGGRRGLLDIFEIVGLIEARLRMTDCNFICAQRMLRMVKWLR